VNRGTIPLASGDKYVDGEVLTVSLDQESENNIEIILEVSGGAQFLTGGSCTGLYRYYYYGGGEALTMPTNTGDTVEIWAGWATKYGQVTLTEKFSLTSDTTHQPTLSPTLTPTLAPTVAPSARPTIADQPSMQPSSSCPSYKQTVSPTLLPSKVTGTEYSLSLEVATTGQSSDSLRGSISILSNTFCGYLHYDPSRCIISYIGASSSSSASSSTAISRETFATSMKRSLSTAVLIIAHSIQPMIRRLRLSSFVTSAADSSASATFVLIVNNFFTSEEASQTLDTLTDYVNDNTELGFRFEFYTSSGLNLTSSVPTASTVTESGDVSLYPFSCDLDESLSLYWMVGSTGDGVSVGTAGGYVLGSVQMKGSGAWFAGGITVNGAVSMVSSPVNTVYYYEPNSKAGGMYTINSYSSSGIQPDDRYVLSRVCITVFTIVLTMVFIGVFNSYGST
jgi:hypothetical protein